MPHTYMMCTPLSLRSSQHSFSGSLIEPPSSVKVPVKKSMHPRDAGYDRRAPLSYLLRCSSTLRQLLKTSLCLETSSVKNKPALSRMNNPMDDIIHKKKCLVFLTVLGSCKVSSSVIQTPKTFQTKRATYTTVACVVFSILYSCSRTSWRRVTKTVEGVGVTHRPVVLGQTYFFWAVD